jgi:hypothetical protein
MIFKIIFFAAIVFGIHSFVKQWTMDRLPKDLPAVLPLNNPINKNESEQKDSTERILIKDNNANLRTSERYSKHSNKVVSASVESPTSNDCEVTTSPHGRSLLAHGDEAQYMNNPASWSVHNNTIATVSIVLSQFRKQVAVVFLGPGQHYQAEIPSSNIDFLVNYTTGNCVNWKSNIGIIGNLPIPSYSRPDFSIRNTAVYKSYISPTSSGIKLSTKFLLYKKEKR